ncbi:MAG: GNAT family N-acetyltransferase, partial [Dehalococcoidia bacterium]
RSAARAFGEHSDPVMQAFIRSITEIERILDAFQNGRGVGSAASHTFELTVPGGVCRFRLWIS